MAEEENKEEINQNTPSIEDENTNSLNTQEGTEEIQNTEVSEEEKKTKQKKVPFLNKILFAVVGFLLIILIIGAVLFFMGFFDAKEENVNLNVDEVQRQEKIIPEETRFNIKDINSKKLNKQLLLLTNKNIIKEEENEKREKQAEEKKIKEAEEKNKKEALALEEEQISKEKELLENKKNELEKQKEELEILKNEAIALRNEMINSKNLLEMNKETINKKRKETEEEIKIEVPVSVPVKKEIEFVSLINVAKIKGELYKTYLDKITAINSDIKLCRDDLNRIEIFYGPFENDAIRNELFEKLQENGIKHSYKVELTKEEFDKRCNY